MNPITATPVCCDSDTKYVFISHSCQFFFCSQCKQEVYAVPGPMELPPMPPPGEDAETLPDFSFGWVIV